MNSKYFDFSIGIISRAKEYLEKQNPNVTGTEIIYYVYHQQRQLAIDNKDFQATNEKLNELAIMFDSYVLKDTGHLVGRLKEWLDNPQSQPDLEKWYQNNKDKF